MKCFAIGMRKELILTEEQKRMKRRIRKPRIQNQQDITGSHHIDDSGFKGQSVVKVTKVEDESKDLMSPECSMNTEPEDVTPKLDEGETFSDTIFFGLKNELCNSFHLHCHSRIDQYFNSCDYSANCSVTKIHEQSFDENTNQGKGEKVGSETRSEKGMKESYKERQTGSVTFLERMAEGEFFVPDHPMYDRDLNHLELYRLKELVEADTSVQGVRDSTVDPKNPNLLDVVKMTDHAIRRFINMSKKLSGFRSLCEQDQIALLKGGCPELMILRSVMTYNTENDYWTDANDKAIMKMEVLKLGSKGKDLYAKNRSFIESFRSLRQDKNIMMILGAITLFTPERPNVQHVDSVK